VCISGGRMLLFVAESCTASHGTTPKNQTTAPLKCGTPRIGRDCPLDYSLESINISAALWRPPDEKAVERLHMQRKAAMLTCERIAKHKHATLTEGSWCLRINHVVARKSGRVHLPNQQSYTLPKGHFAPDESIVHAVHRLLKNSTTRPYLSMTDFGAGVGQYGHSLLALDSSHHISLYDGAGDVENVTDGFVQNANLADEDLTVPRTDWVFSTDVGEHIPHNIEAGFIRNLHVHNRCGIILSWATLRLNGHAHVNNHSPLYVQSLFERLGYFVHRELSDDLRGHGPSGRARDIQPRSLYTPGRDIQRNIRAYARYTAGPDCGV